ncbi:MAG: UDP-glucose 4-epimerase GalE [Finegoldia magna]|uniref:UDP-glucose 4-epimerase GalE n=1 Tax=Finegoldia magna TaxID=1260 RepID=UPI002912A812|nr:UDP-glucose 4-epimerase GalE [Finegoldia magna]MDU7330953.1 UDP-glucose 4-epimerase GalE [Finegoldia magna]
MKILLAGGAGYIGSHIAVELLRKNYEVIVVDNFSNSSNKVIERIKNICHKEIKYYKINILNKTEMLNILKEEKPNCIVHLAGYKSVSESLRHPLEYYENNLGTTISILEAMKKSNCTNIIFSSSATVYGSENSSPYLETMKRGKCTNAYGWTKYFSEQILIDEYLSNKNISSVILRYFNPIGADKTGMIGENPNGVPNNLMPYITQVAIGKLNKLTIYGNDYNTSDGTCLRDFIHVSDLALGHISAIDYVMKNKCCEIINLGTGKPNSVLEVVNTFKKINGVQIPFEFGKRRKGDLDEVWADISKAKLLLNWEPIYSLEDMCRDSWNWQKNNPEGYML